MLQKGHLSYFKILTVLTHSVARFVPTDSIFKFVARFDDQWRPLLSPANFIQTIDNRTFFAEL
jgi:hypothetical protein